ncbi:MAG: YceD family protein [Bacillota bacterium]
MAYNINLSRVRNAVGTTSNYELTETTLDLGSQLQITKPIRISLMITNNGRILELKGFVNTEIESACGRCLEKVTIPINAVIEEELLYFADARYLENLTQDEIEERFLIFDNDLLDLRNVIRESILIALPYKVLCSDDCLGLCIKCGQNLNKQKCNCKIEEIDPRLAVLAKLKGIEEV